MANILVIEDDSSMQFMLKEKLKFEGFTPIIATNGEQGINFYKAGTIDLVITDIFMPDKDGLETICELKNRFPDVKIIAISGGGRFSANKSLDYLDMATHFGAQKIMEKPFMLNDLVKTINEIL